MLSNVISTNYVSMDQLKKNLQLSFSRDVAHMRCKISVIWHLLLFFVFSGYLEHSLNRLIYHNSLIVLNRLKTLAESS